MKNSFTYSSNMPRMAICSNI